MEGSGIEVNTEIQIERYKILVGHSLSRLIQVGKLKSVFKTHKLVVIFLYVFACLELVEQYTGSCEVGHSSTQVSTCYSKQAHHVGHTSDDIVH